MNILGARLMGACVASVVRNSLAGGRPTWRISIRKRVPCFMLPLQRGQPPQTSVLLMGRARRGLMLLRRIEFLLSKGQTHLHLPKQGLIKPLAAHMRSLGRLCNCPECRVKCKTPMYVSRRATKLHAAIREANPCVRDWARNCQVPTNPCAWCGESYKTQAKAHCKACPVLWSCGHMLHRYSILKPPGKLR